MELWPWASISSRPMTEFLMNGWPQCWTLSVSLRSVTCNLFIREVCSKGKPYRSHRLPCPLPLSHPLKKYNSYRIRCSTVTDSSTYVNNLKLFAVSPAILTDQSPVSWQSCKCSWHEIGAEEVWSNTYAEREVKLLTGPENLNTTSGDGNKWLSSREQALLSRWDGCCLKLSPGRIKS